MPKVGEIWEHSEYYVDETSGEYLPKYFLVLAVYSDGDVVYRLLTSRPYNRPVEPKCFHGVPYPGFYLGVLNPRGKLNKETWLDLREQEDYDAIDFAGDTKSGLIKLLGALSESELCLALSCASNAPDTTRRQSGAMGDSRQLIGCST